MANRRERLVEQYRLLVEETRRIIRISRELLAQPVPDTFLGRSTKKPREKAQD